MGSQHSDHGVCTTCSAHRRTDRPTVPRTSVPCSKPTRDQHPPHSSDGETWCTELSHCSSLHFLSSRDPFHFALFSSRTNEEALVPRLQEEDSLASEQGRETSCFSMRTLA